jgi:tetratricopeptide (TPR) repeat protein
LVIGPKYEAALYDKGLTLSNIGNYAEATQYYDKALMIDPKNIHLLTDKGNALSNLGNYTEAIQSYNKALVIDPNHVSTLKGKQNAISKLIASAPTSGYSRGCSDSEISKSSDRYINQPGKGPSFHSKAFMQTYTEGFDACSNNSNDSRIKLGTTASVQKPYWTSSNVTVSPDLKKYHLFLDGVDGIFQNGNENLRVCLDANNGDKHAVCHPIKGGTIRKQ